MNIQSKDEKINKNEPSKGWYIVAVLLLLSGLYISYSIIKKEIGMLNNSFTRIIIPGESIVTFDKAQRYTLNYEYKSIVNGKEYVTDNEFPSGLNLRIIDLRTNQEINLFHTHEMNYSTEDYKGKSLFSFTIPSEGRYKIVGSTTNGSDLQNVVLSIDHGFIPRLLMMIFKALVISVGCGFAACLIALLTFLKRCDTKRKVDQNGSRVSTTYGETGEADDSECLFAMMVHLIAIVSFLGVPFGNIIGPLIVWLLKRKESTFVDYHGKEALNFQISMTIYSVLATILIVVLIGFLCLIVLAIAQIVLIIRASIKAHNGEYYRYPFTIRFIR